MPYFAVQYTYSPTTAPGRDEHRATHRAWLGELLTQDVLVSSGPFTDDSGALIIVRGEDLESTRTLFESDPFATEQLIESVRISEWKPVMGLLT